MTDMLLALAAWYVCGVAGFLYWWTEDFALDRRALRDALAFGVMGPAALAAGWMVHRILRREHGDLQPIRIESRDRRRR